MLRLKLEYCPTSTRSSPVLNETYLLRQALERAGVTPPGEHPRVKRPGKTGPCFVVALSEEGCVTRINKITEDEWPGLWTIMEGNQNSFPVVRIKEPVLNVPRGHS